MKSLASIKALAIASLCLNSTLVLAQSTQFPKLEQKKQLEKSLLKLRSVKSLDKELKPEINKDFLAPFKGMPTAELIKIINKKDEAKERSRGGSFDGGGGLVIACVEKGKVTLTIADYYRKFFPVSLPGNTYLEKIDGALDRFEKIAPVRANIYRNMIADMLLGNANIQPNFAIPYLRDEGDFGIEKNCVKIQAAMQKSDKLLNLPLSVQKKYDIDADVFNAMDENNKAGLLLHEAIYYEARLFGATNSEMAQYMNALISSDRASELSQADYEELLANMNIREHNETDGLPFMDSHKKLEKFVPDQIFIWTDPSKQITAKMNPTKSKVWGKKSNNTKYEIYVREFNRQNILLNNTPAQYSGQARISISDLFLSLNGAFNYHDRLTDIELNDALNPLPTDFWCSDASNLLCPVQMMLDIDTNGMVTGIQLSNRYTRREFEMQKFPPYVFKRVRINGVEYSNFENITFSYGRVTEYRSNTTPALMEFMGTKFYTKDFNVSPTHYIKVDSDATFNFQLPSGKVQKITLHPGEYLKHTLARLKKLDATGFSKFAIVPDDLDINQPQELLTADGLQMCEAGNVNFYRTGFVFSCLVKTSKGIEEKRFPNDPSKDEYLDERW